MSNKSRRRPDSRASTTSIQSSATQPILEQYDQHKMVDYQKQFYDNNSAMQHMPQQRFPGMEHQMQEHMLVNTTSHIHPHQSREFGHDPNLHGVVDQSMGYPMHDGLRLENQRHSLPGDGYNTSFNGDDSPIIDGRSDEQEEGDSIVGPSVAGAPKKVSKSSAANEMEMRSLFANNKHRTLPEVARELHGNERGPQSERTRQVFAMLWSVISPHDPVLH